MRITIKLKLAITFAVIILLASAMAWLGVSSLSSLNTGMRTMLDGPVQRALIEYELQTDALQVMRAEKNMMLYEGAEQIAAFESKPARGPRSLQSALRQGLCDRFGGGQEEDRHPQRAVAEMGQRPGSVSANSFVSGKLAEAKDLHITQSGPASNEVLKILEELIDLNNKLSEEAQKQAVSQYEDMRGILLATAIIVVLIGLGAAVWISLSISRGLARASRLADAVAAGDLNQKISVKTPRRGPRSRRLPQHHEREAALQSSARP